MFVPGHLIVYSYASDVNSLFIFLLTKNYSCKASPAHSPFCYGKYDSKHSCYHILFVQCDSPCWLPPGTRFVNYIVHVVKWIRKIQNIKIAQMTEYYKAPNFSNSLFCIEPTVHVYIADFLPVLLTTANYQCTPLTQRQH